jgi:hypothetical protein
MQRKCGWYGPRLPQPVVIILLRRTDAFFCGSSENEEVDCGFRADPFFHVSSSEADVEGAGFRTDRFFDDEYWSDRQMCLVCIVREDIFKVAIDRN